MAVYYRMTELKGYPYVYRPKGLIEVIRTAWLMWRHPETVSVMVYLNPNWAACHAGRTAVVSPEEVKTHDFYTRTRR